VQGTDDEPRMSATRRSLGVNDQNVSDQEARSATVRTPSPGSPRERENTERDSHDEEVAAPAIPTEEEEKAKRTKDDVKDDEPAGLIKSLIAGGLAEGMLAHNHVEATPAEQKRPPSIATAVEDEAVAPKGKQAPKDLEKGANVTGNAGTMARILRAKLFGEIAKVHYGYVDICDSEPAMELISLVGRTEAGAIFEEVLEAQNQHLKQRLLKVNPNRGKRAQPRRRFV
jgi:hypothetical protein